MPWHALPLAPPYDGRFSTAARSLRSSTDESVVKSRANTAGKCLNLLF